MSKATQNTEMESIVNSLAKLSAVMGITNALIAQPEGVTEGTLWSQVHPDLERAEFDHVLAHGVQIGALVQAGDRYRLADSPALSQD